MRPGTQLLMMSAALVLRLGVTGNSAVAATTETVTWDLGEGLQAELGPPVVVSTSGVGEKRWGHHQFVSISEYPGGKILLRHHAADDAVKAYGTPSPTYISSDQGRTWQPFQAEGLPSSGQTYPLRDGHFICMPMAKPFDAMTTGITLPPPLGRSHSYSRWNSYLVEQCPAPVQDYMKNYAAVRWEPQTGAWKPEQVVYDTRKALVWSAETKPATRLLSRTCFERPPLPVGDELLFADYRSNFVEEDGTVPRQWGVTCMVSQDNGRSWERRSTIALDREGTDSLTEPMLARNVKGELVCVIRRADHQQKPMCMTWSGDNGRTWEKPVSLDKMGNYGVFPALITLDCGVMVLSYGRPGISLSFSTDGLGRTWTDPFCMIPGDPKKLLRHTDGYTSMLALGKDRLLLAYSDFDYRDAEGKPRKAIMVRPVTIRRTADVAKR